MTLQDRLAAELARLAATRQTATYGDLARLLEVPPPASIAKLTLALEQTMVEDAAAGRPFRAALCAARLGGGLPAPGFFEMAVRLGRFHGQVTPDAARGYAESERSALYRAAESG